MDKGKLTINSLIKSTTGEIIIYNLLDYIPANYVMKNLNN